MVAGAETAAVAAGGGGGVAVVTGRAAAAVVAAVVTRTGSLMMIEIPLQRRRQNQRLPIRSPPAAALRAQFADRVN